jgi:AcrR family transcriptional regulator
MAAKNGAVLEPRTPRGRATRERLLRAAETSFARNGYARTSVAEISRAAGGSHGGFYVYFPSKHAIFAELIRHLAAEIRGVTRGAMENAQTRLDAELAGTRAFFRWLQDHRDLHRLLHLIDEVDATLAIEFYSSIAKGYADGLRSAMESGEVQEVDPELLAYALMGMNQFVSMRWLLWSDAEVMSEERLDDFMRIVAGALAGPRAA